MMGTVYPRGNAGSAAGAKADNSTNDAVMATSGKNLPPHLGVPLGADQPLLQTLERERKLPRVQAEQVKDRCLQVVDGKRPLGNEVTQFVRRPEGNPRFDP